MVPEKAKPLMTIPEAGVAELAELPPAAEVIGGVADVAGFGDELHEAISIESAAAPAARA
jgi:hypothetical protein